MRLGNKTLMFYIAIISFVAIVLMPSVIPVTAKAEVSAEDFAVYHDRAFNITNYWHSGMMLTDSPENGYSGTFMLSSGNSQTISNSDYSVVHLSSASGNNNSGSTVGFIPFSSFVGSKTFEGYFTSVTNPTVEQRRVILATAQKFYNYTLLYRALNQIDYTNHVITYNSTDVIPSQVTKFRCDGFVEYCYEYNNIRVFGPAANSEESWDISNNCTPSRSVHNTGSLSTLSPEIQALNMRCKLGDVNADGTLTAADARLVLRYTADLITFNDYQKFVADVTGNGNSVTAADARLIMNAAAGLEGDGVTANIGTNAGYRFPKDPFA